MTAQTQRQEAKGFRPRVGSTPLYGATTGMFRWVHTEDDPSPLSEHLDEVARQQGGLPDAARRLVHAPEWANIIYVEGWVHPKDMSWCDWKTAGSTMEFHFDRVLAEARYLPGEVSLGRQPTEVTLCARHRITSDGTGRFTYREDPLYVVMSPETGDAMEFALEDATVLLGGLRRALKMAEGLR